MAGKLTVKALAEKVKQAFDLPFVLVYGEELMDMEIEKVALCPGAGGSVIEEAIHAGAKALVTGDISHHQGIDAAARDMAVIDAGHYGMEHICGGRYSSICMANCSFIIVVFVQLMDNVLPEFNMHLCLWLSFCQSCLNFRGGCNAVSQKFWYNWQKIFS